jgi:hypothetical protein
MRHSWRRLRQETDQTVRAAARVLGLELRSEPKTLRPALTDWFEPGMAFPGPVFPFRAGPGIPCQFETVSRHAHSWYGAAVLSGETRLDCLHLPRNER